jgi:hypothetical protein
MVQTRTEAAGLVVRLQREALGQGVMLYGVAAIAAMAFIITVLLLIALGTPPEYRVLVLGLVAAALLAAAVFGARQAGQRLKRDAGLIADYTRGLRLDLALVNLALRDADTDDPEKLRKREEAKEAVREAAAEKAATPSTASGAAFERGGAYAGADGVARETAEAAMSAAAPGRRDAQSREAHWREAVAAAEAADVEAGLATGTDGRVADLRAGVVERDGAPPKGVDGDAVAEPAPGTPNIHHDERGRSAHGRA